MILDCLATVAALVLYGVVIHETTNVRDTWIVTTLAAVLLAGIWT